MSSSSWIIAPLPKLVQLIPMRWYAAMDAAAAVGEAENRLAAAREEIIAANSALIFARAHEAAVLPLVASTYEELQRLMETQEVRFGARPRCP